MSKHKYIKTTRTNSFNNQRLYFFDNGYGASVVSGPHTYGGSSGLYELAVLKGDVANNDLCYDTKITNDVVGWLTDEQVQKILRKIRKLPKE